MLQAYYFTCSTKERLHFSIPLEIIKANASDSREISKTCFCVLVIASGTNDIIFIVITLHFLKQFKYIYICVCVFACVCVHICIIFVQYTIQQIQCSSITLLYSCILVYYTYIRNVKISIIFCACISYNYQINFINYVPYLTF